MKNLMKKQLKKSFSLFLAVLMLMSCWVWLAPQKAEAGAPNSYDVVITTGSDNRNACEDTHRIVFTHADGTTTEKNWGNAQNEVAGNETFTLTKWPKKIYFQVGSKNVAKARITRITINGIEIFNGGYNLSATGGVLWENKAEWTLEAGGTQAGQTANWTAPKYADSVTTLTGASHTLNVINSGINSTSTISIGSITDQYGVNYTGSVTFSASLRVDDGITLGSNATITGSGNSRTITITPWFQTLYSGKQSAKLYIDWNVNSGAKSGTETINITFPTYKATFHANGGKIGADDTEAKDSIEYTGEKMNIGSVIGKAPAYATKTGFEFKGFYSTQNADATGKTASFSGTLFEDDVTTFPAASSGNGDTNWYAAWQALPITATFLTQDGQLIGTVEGRYNNYMTASNMYNGDAGLNAAVKASHTAGKVKFNGNNEPIYTDGSTSYTFAGWKIIKAYDESVMDKNEDTVLQGDVTFQAVYTKADAATYTVSFEDGNGNTQITQTGKKYREEITGITYEPTKAQDDRYDYEFIGWAKDIGKNFYVVDATDRDENGATIVYTHKDGAEFIVKGDASYVPVFRMVPREYKVTYNYIGDNEVNESTFIEGYHWQEAPRMPEIKDNYTAGGYRYYLLGWKINNAGEVKSLDEIAVEGDMTLTAVYGNREAAKYTINFYGKDADGETNVHLNASANSYEHNDTVTAPDVAQTIDTADALYTFAGWSPEINATASGDADYYATYTKKEYADIHFYNYDGTLIYETAGKDNSLFVGDTIPAYTGETPVKAEDVIGTYNFIGWKDGAGNDVVPGAATFNGDTYLYAQFETVYKEYTVKFVNEGTTVSETKYRYGEEITVPADPTKQADVEYIYDFRAWSPDVSEVCYGDATYEATYRRTPQYYTVTWLNDNKAVHTESNYKYNQTIQQAVINDPVGYEAPATGKTWAFKHWVQCDENGNNILVDGQQVIFRRGMKMSSEHLYFYPVFEEAANVLTVTFYKEDGTTPLGEAKIPYGESIMDYADAFAKKAPKLSDDTYHYIIENWVNKDTGAAVTTINADVSVKATYTAKEHNKQIYEIIAEPTCNVPGYAHYKCDVEECTDIDYNVAIAPIADEGAPTGQFYVGSNKWTLEDFKNGIDHTDIKYVSPSTNVIVNAQDKGSVSEQNPEGKLNRGVGKIEYYVSDTQISNPAQIAEGAWTAVYNYESFRSDALNVVLAEKKITLLEYNGYNHGTAEDRVKKAAIDREVDALLSNYNANATGVLSNLNLENGKTYIIYIRISDREGNGEVNRCYLSSGTISYGTTAPEIAVSGEGYGTKYCAEATVTVTDDTDSVKVYLDGTEVALTDGKFTCNAAGLHTVTAVDKNGNKTTKTFEIKGNHTYRNYTTAATCENDGSRYDLCTVCGHKENEVVISALGHSYTANYIDKAATCVADGYRTYVCDNNCGTKLVLKPTDDAETLAQAKKAVKDADGKEVFVALTAEDLKDLKATGEHTYAKVKDANGEDTSVDAWIIDKEATCSVTGSKHKDCTKCGYRVTDEIPLDTENGHKFYREKVTKEPTCTETGEKTKTCRYCGYVELVEPLLPALGHTAGEYKITTEPTCTEIGYKVLTCATCGYDIGEPEEKDGKIVFNGKKVEIKPLEHAWSRDGEIQKLEDKNSEGEIVTVYVQYYKCDNGCGETYKEILDDYVEPKEVTVTFMNGNADENPVVLNKFVGESIIATAVATPTKAANATYKYTFSHWADADGKEVKFPISVKEAATYYAVYTEKFINYTITYYTEAETETGTELKEYKKTGYLHNGEEVTLEKGPSKAETKLVKYVFAGWQVTNGSTVYTDKITIDGANINLKATYTTVQKKYAVTYAYSSSNILETFEVVAGQPAGECGITPEKAKDSKYHYEFKAWNKAEQLAKVENNIYTTPIFESALHNYNHPDGKVLKTPATCTADAVHAYTCTCGYSYEKEEPNTALGHNWGEPKYNEETGKNVVKCQREGCGVSEEDTRTFTVKFYIEATDTEAKKTVSYIPWGTKIDATRLPSNPTKESTATTDYTFKGWAVKGTTDVVDVTKIEIKSDTDFVAVFTETTREYNVIFAYDANNVIKTFTNVPAGSSVTFDGAKPVKGCDINYHHTFSGWNGYADTKHDLTVTDIQSDLYILATFKDTKHTYTTYQLSSATCQNGTGTRYYCDCNGDGKFTDKVNGEFVDYFYDVTGKPLEHDWKEINKVEATPNKDGYIEYKCSSCGETKKDVIKYNDNTIQIKVYVKHNGAPESGVKVEIQPAVGTSVFASTNKDGVATFTVDKDGIYNCYVGEVHVALEKDGDTLVGIYEHNDAVDCSCACHRTNFWGTIFRFFHKIIKMFTGQFKCCGNPDPMYG